MIRVQGTVTHVERADFDISQAELLKSLSKIDQTDVLNQVRKNFARVCTRHAEAFLWNNTWQVYVNNGNHYSGDEKIRDATSEEIAIWKGLTALIVDYKMAIQSHPTKEITHDTEKTPV